MSSADVGVQVDGLSQGATSSMQSKRGLGSASSSASPVATKRQRNTRSSPIAAVPAVPAAAVAAVAAEGGADGVCEAMAARRVLAPALSVGSNDQDILDAMQAAPLPAKRGALKADIAPAKSTQAVAAKRKCSAGII